MFCCWKTHTRKPTYSWVSRTLFHWSHTGMFLQLVHWHRLSSLTTTISWLLVDKAKQSAYGSFLHIQSALKWSQWFLLTRTAPSMWSSRVVSQVCPLAGISQRGLEQTRLIIWTSVIILCYLFGYIFISLCLKQEKFGHSRTDPRHIILRGCKVKRVNDSMLCFCFSCSAV